VSQVTSLPSLFSQALSDWNSPPPAPPASKGGGTAPKATPAISLLADVTFAKEFANVPGSINLGNYVGTSLGYSPGKTEETGGPPPEFVQIPASFSGKTPKQPSSNSLDQSQLSFDVSQKFGIDTFSVEVISFVDGSKPAQPLTLSFEPAAPGGTSSPKSASSLVDFYFAGQVTINKIATICTVRLYGYQFVEKHQK
jgi:hypothetical protein